MKGKQLVKRISDSIVEAITGHADFFLEDPTHTYIRVYGSKDRPYLLPRYANNRLILMEFCKQLFFLYENMWKKKDATINLPISIRESTCTSWNETNEMKNELTYYHFWQGTSGQTL